MEIKRLVEGGPPIHPRARVALATCAEVPEGDEDAPALAAALAERGVEAVPAVWDARGADWVAFDLVVVRSTWDYAERHEAFLAWAESLPRVVNPPAVLRWSTDKRYLEHLAGAGVPVVPTRFLRPGEPFEPGRERVVVKPAVSAGGRRSATYEPEAAAEAEAHVRRLQAEGRTVMVQPYMQSVEERGEIGLVYLGGCFSHAFRKGALLRPGQAPGEALYLEEDIGPADPSGTELEVAEAALAAAPFEVAEMLYARVDLVEDAERGPLVLELELAEPSLYLAFGDGSAERFGELIAARV